MLSRSDMREAIEVRLGIEHALEEGWYLTEVEECTIVWVCVCVCVYNCAYRKGVLHSSGSNS